MSKHETGTVTKRLTKQTTGALQFVVAFALRGGGGGGGGGETSLLCPSTTKATVSKQETYC